MARGLGGLLGALGRPSGDMSEAEEPAPDLEAEEGEAATSPSDAEVVAAGEVRTAFDSGDDENLARALRRFVRVMRD